MTNDSMSPAAQAVLDAANGRSSYGPDDCLNESRWIAAAALRAAADQVVPAPLVTPGGSKIWPSEPALSIRESLLAIAAELEGNHPESPDGSDRPTVSDDIADELEGTDDWPIS
jgi:hypothetical protein